MVPVEKAIQIPSGFLTVKRIHSSQCALRSASSVEARIKVRAHARLRQTGRPLQRTPKLRSNVVLITLVNPSDLLKIPNKGSCANPRMRK